MVNRIKNIVFRISLIIVVILCFPLVSAAFEGYMDKYGPEYYIADAPSPFDFSGEKEIDNSTYAVIAYCTGDYEVRRGIYYTIFVSGSVLKGEGIDDVFYVKSTQLIRPDIGECLLLLDDAKSEYTAGKTYYANFICTTSDTRYFKTITEYLE